MLSFLFLLINVVHILVKQIELHDFAPNSAFSVRPTGTLMVYLSCMCVMEASNPLLHHLYKFEIDSCDFQVTLAIIDLNSRFSCFLWVENILVKICIKLWDALTNAAACLNINLFAELFVCLHCLRFLTNRQCFPMAHIECFVCTFEGSLSIVPHFHLWLFFIRLVQLFEVKRRRHLRG